MNTSQTGDKPLVYKLPSDELTQHETEKLLRLGRAVKRGELSLGLFELAYGKNDELHIVGLKKAA